MQNLQDIIAKILEQSPNLTREAVLVMVQQKRDGAGKLLTDEGAAHLVAGDLGVSLSGSGSFKNTLDTKDLIIGSSDVSLSGKVVLTYPTQTFRKKDGAEGRVGRFVLQDGTGSTKIVLWDENAELLDRQRIPVGSIVRVNHGYVRPSLDGKPEVNVGKRGSVVVQASGNESVNQTITYKKIHEISDRDLSVNVKGIVVSASPPSFFTRSDGTSGQVSRIQIGDETGQIRITLWNEQAEFAVGIERDDAIEIVNGRTRKGLAGELEVHVSQTSEVNRLSSLDGLGVPKLVTRKIRDLVPGLMSVDVLARVAILGQERVFQRQTGDDGKVADATIIDGTGSLRLSMWDEKAEILKQLKTGDIILLRGAYTREGFNGSIALNIGKMGTVTINPEMAEAEELPEYSAVTKIAELRDGFPASVQAEVVEAPSEKKIRTKDGRDLTVVSLRLRDNTGEIGISLWNENAEKAKNYALGTKLRISDAFTRIGYDGDLELSTRTFTKIETISDKTLLDSSENESASRFSEGEHFEGNAILLEASRSTVENTCPNCGGNVRERDGSFICNECGRIPRANQRLILEAVLESNGRELTAVFSGNDAETLLGADYDYSTNLISQGLDENILVESAKKQLKGRRLKIEGTVVESSATRLRIDVSRVEQFLN